MRSANGRRRPPGCSFSQNASRNAMATRITGPDASFANACRFSRTSEGKHADRHGDHRTRRPGRPRLAAERAAQFRLKFVPADFADYGFQLDRRFLSTKFEQRPVAALRTRLRHAEAAAAPFLDDLARAGERGIGGVEALHHHGGEGSGERGKRCRARKARKETSLPLGSRCATRCACAKMLTSCSLPSSTMRCVRVESTAGMSAFRRSESVAAGGRG